MLTLIAYIATVTGLCSSAMPVFQLRKMVRNRSAAGISVVWLSASLTNGLIWLSYGLLLHNAAIALSNGLWSVMCVAQIGLALRLNARPKQHPIAEVARAVAEDPALADEFESLVREHEANRLSTVETLVLRPRKLGALAIA